MMPLTLRAAFRLLTIVPLRWDPREAELQPARSTLWFPLVGLALGILLYAIMLLPVGALPRAAVCLVIWIALSGGLHEDGLMDCADAAFAPVDAAKRAAIRKDAHVGAHAVTVVVLLTLVRFAALTEAGAPAVVLAPVVGRWSMALTLALFEAHPTSTLGAAFAGTARARAVSAFAFAIVLMLAVWQRDPRFVTATAVALVAALGCARWLARRFGGASGDVHGAAGVVAEAITLCALVPV